MSIEALNAVTATFPTIKARLGEIPVDERPSFDAVTSVSQHLANKHRPGRGYVNESVDQIAEALCMSPRKVRRALAALDVLGVWVSQGRGNRHTSTRRIAAFLDPSTASGYRTENEQENSVRLPDGEEILQRPVAGPTASGSGSTASGNRTTPPSNPQCVPPKKKVGVISRPLTTGTIESPAHLADFARRIIAEERPDQPVTEKPAAANAAAERWLRVLSTAAEPHQALRNIEPVLRWALRHRWWGQRLTSVTRCQENWTDVVAQHRAETALAEPKPSPGQQSGLTAAQQFMNSRTAEAPTIELDPPRKELA